MYREPASHSLSSSGFPPWKKVSRGVRPASKQCFLDLLVSHNGNHQVVSRSTAFDGHARPAKYVSKLLALGPISRHSTENQLQDGVGLRGMDASGTGLLSSELTNHLRP